MQDHGFCIVDLKLFSSVFAFVWCCVPCCALQSLRGLVPKEKLCAPVHITRATYISSHYWIISISGSNAKPVKIVVVLKHTQKIRISLLAGQKGRVRKRNSTLLTRRLSVWKLPMGASDTEFDRLSGKHPAVLRSTPLGVPTVYF